MRDLRDDQISTLAAWLQVHLMPIADPWHEGEVRRLPSPKATARYIMEILETVELDHMNREFERVAESQRDCHE